MYQADKITIESGLAGVTLMENAGQAVFDAIVEHYVPVRAIVLCGPGNNGGDGFVVARLLKEAGWDVCVSCYTDPDNLTGDAAHMASLWDGAVSPIADSIFDGIGLVVDALFGAGLDREIESDIVSLIKAVEDLPVIAIDMPSGINGNTGADMGIAFNAQRTVTFFKAKPGHYLYPGKMHAGQITVADIGIKDSVCETIKPSVIKNSPELWRSIIPKPKPGDHKYSRGYALITGGKEMIGAAKLAARAAQRIGAGMVTVASPEKVAPLYRMAMESVVVKSFRDTAYYKDIISDQRIDACLIGPGLGQDFTSQERVLTTLRAGHKCVLDADALSMFAGHAELLVEHISDNCVLTPHEGEFNRIFPQFTGQDKVARVTQAAKLSGATILLKGADTVIADKDGSVIINHNAPATLATAGAGDVLAGMIVGLIAQGNDSLAACAIASWLHGEAANLFGPGLIAEDIIQNIPEVLSSLLVLELS